MSNETARQFVPDVLQIGNTIKAFLDRVDVEWSSFFAYEVSPVAETDDEAHDEVALHRVYWRGIAVSDLVVAHHGDNGTSNLGALVELAVNAKHRPHILLLIPRGSTVSRAWLGYAKRYPKRVSLVYFDSSDQDGRERLDDDLREYLYNHLEILRSGPDRRRALEGALKQLVEEVRRGWRRLTDIDRDWLAEELCDHVDFIADMIDDPLLLAQLGTTDQLILMRAFKDLGLFRWTRAERSLGSVRLAAWNDWRGWDTIDEDFAHDVLARAVTTADLLATTPTDDGLHLYEAAAWQAYSESSGRR